MGAHVFITTLGVSSLIFARAYPDEKEAAVIDAMNHCFSFYGGVPQIMRPDNAKTFVIKNRDKEVILNATFKDLETFYGLPTLPARPLRPRDKGTVEAAAGYLERNVLSQMKKHIYTSFDEFNADLAKRVEALNNRISKATGKSRRQVFDELDRPVLKPLPHGEFSPYECFVRKVQDNYHVQAGDFYYSIPHTLYVKGAGTNVMVKQNAKEVIICTMDNQLICRHERGQNLHLGRFITNPKHRPPNHQYAEMEMADDEITLLKSAEKIGPNMESMIRAMFAGQKFPAHVFTVCRACLNACQSYPRSIGEAAAEEFLDGENPITITYKSFKTTLDRLAGESGILKHENLRGGDDFK